MMDIKSWKILKDYQISSEFNYILVKRKDVYSKMIEIKPSLNKKNILPYVIDPKLVYKKFKIILSEKVPDGYFLVQDIKSNTSTSGIIYLKLHYLQPKEFFKQIQIPWPSSIRRVGTILHLCLKKEHDSFKTLIGDYFLCKFKWAKSIITKKRYITDRVDSFIIEVLAGEKNMEVIYKENQINLFIKYNVVHFSSRLEYERKLLRKEVSKRGAIIADASCYLGEISFSLMKYGFQVYANECRKKYYDCVKKSLEYISKDDQHRHRLLNTNASNFVQIMMIYRKVDHFIFLNPEESLFDMHPLKWHKKEYTLHAYFVCKRNINTIEFLKDYIWFSVKNEDIRFVKNISPSKNLYKLTKFFTLEKPSIYVTKKKKIV